ncbi:MAG: DUF4936 family protein [Pseudomonadota bacterium]
MDLYIYYRVPGAQAARLQAAIGTLQARIVREHGVAAGLKRRPGEQDGKQTWMEIYQAIPEGFEAVLAQRVLEADLASMIDGERHTEHFLDLNPCA